MRDDVVEASVVLSHPPEVVWRIAGAPDWYSRFVPAISGFEMLAQAGNGRGPRGTLRVTRERGDVLEVPVQTVVYRTAEQVVWCGVPDDGSWVSLELRPAGSGTRLTVRVRLPQSQADLVAAMQREIPALTRRLELFLSGTPDPEEPHTPTRASHLRVAKILVRAGVLAPGRPDKILRQLKVLGKWGATVAGGYGAAAARSADEPALQDERMSLTFGQLDERTDRLATALVRLGIRAGDRIALMCRNHASMVEVYIVASKLGADLVLLNTGLPAAAVADVIAAHRPAAVLSDDEFGDAVAAAPGQFVRISTWAESEAGDPTVEELIEQAPPERREPPERPGRIVVLTAGTTGVPKGARRPTPKGLATAASLLSGLPLRSGDRIVLAAPLFHSWGLAAMQLAMALRTPLSLVRWFDAEELLRTVSGERGNALFAVPIILQRILELPERVRNRYDLSSLRIVASAGSALHPTFVTEFMDTFGDILYNVYGSTEVSTATIAGPADLRAAPSTAGRCPPGTRLALFDDDGRLVPPGGEGQIFVENDFLFDGYTDAPDPATARGLMSTGDVGYVDAGGRLFVTGRADEMIVSGGENVFPRPVEDVLMSLRGVSDVAVVGVPDAEYGQRLAAYVVPRPGAQLEADDVRDHVHERLARFAVPRDVYFVPELPRNTTGKILKRLLHEDSWPASEY